MTATLKITDGTTEVDLLDDNAGFYLNSWRPSIMGFKGGGTFQSSPLSDGRRLVSRQYLDAIDTFNLKIRDGSQDSLIRETQELRRLLEKAVNYWVTDWQDEPVWIEAQATCETNLRYALVKSWDTPSDDNPFAQPFLGHRGSAAMNDWSLIIERGPWLADQPGTGTCVQISGGTGDPISYLVFNETDSEINCGSDAGLDDLHDAAFTVEAWVRKSSAITGDHFIAQKGSGWHFLIEGTPGSQGLQAIIFCATQNALSRTAQDIIDDTWHHVAMTWDDATFNFPLLWIDGVQAAYSLTQNRNGAVVSDAALNFTIGNLAITFVDGWGGDIGWLRVSDNVRYAAGFTPPARCTFPSSDANTVAIWIREGFGTTVYNGEGTSARDGTVSDATWATDCTTTPGRDATCNEDEIYVGNKRNDANLTHIFVDDGGAFGVNLLGTALPYNLLPAVPAVNDAAYFGVSAAAILTGPFCSLVFDIGTAITNITTILWEYWDGAAWTAITATTFVQDNTNADGLMTGEPFDTTDVKSVHWEQPNDWATTAVNGITGYWVRARVAAIGVGPTGPTQQNRDVYTITWNGFGVASTAIAGDIPAIIEVKLRNQSDGNFGSGGSSDLYANRVITGLRSDDRGAGFTSYINLADVQNPTGITVSATAATAFATDSRAPTGRKAVTTNTGAAWSSEISVAFDTDTSSDYIGSYHAFLIVDQTSGVSGDISMRLVTRVTAGNVGGFSFTTDSVATPSTGRFVVLDMGALNIPSSAMIDTSDIFEFTIFVQMFGDGAADIDSFALALIPTDEWAADLIDSSRGQTLGGRRVTDATYLDIDAISSPKLGMRPLIRRYSDDAVATLYTPVFNSMPFLQNNSQQTLYFLCLTHSSATIATADPEIASSLIVTANQRYFSMRGDR